MPVVTVSKDIQGPREAVYQMAADMESFPKFMPAVRSVTVLERKGNETLSEWKVNLKGRPVNWEERDVFDPDSGRITFDLTKGDLKKFSGYWLAEQIPGGTRLTLTVDFEFGIPMLANLLNPIARVVLRDNSEMMLKAIKKAVESE